MLAFLPLDVKVVTMMTEDYDDDYDDNHDGDKETNALIFAFWR